MNLTLHLSNCLTALFMIDTKIDDAFIDAFVTKSDEASVDAFNNAITLCSTSLLH